jgi:hypothetical protein
MIETGREKNWLRSGVEYTIAATRPPGRSDRRIPLSARCWSGKKMSPTLEMTAS